MICKKPVDFRGLEVRKHFEALFIELNNHFHRHVTLCPLLWLNRTLLFCMCGRFSVFLYSIDTIIPCNIDRFTFLKIDHKQETDDITLPGDIWAFGRFGKLSPAALSLADVLFDSVICSIGIRKLYTVTYGRKEYFLSCSK